MELLVSLRMVLSFVCPNRLLVMVLFSAGLQLLEH
jgi:hypothetical protein